MNLKVGQLWELRVGSTNLTSLIGRIDQINNETVISIRLKGVPVPADLQSRLSENKFFNFTHLPIAQSAFLSDLSILLDENQDVPEGFEEGYEIWREAVEDGTGGWFNDSVSSALNYMFETMAKGR